MDQKEKQLRKAIKEVLRGTLGINDKKRLKEGARGLAKLFNSLGREKEEKYTLGEIRLMYADFVDTVVESCEKWRYDDCVDMFANYMETGSTHKTLEELKT